LLFLGHNFCDQKC